MKIVIPAAGHSRRFLEADYSIHKIFLSVGNQLMIESVLNMFDHDEDEFLLILNQDVMRSYQFHLKLLAARYPKLQILGIENHENGPSFSLFRSEVQNFVSGSDFIVTYCDFFVDWDYRGFLMHLEQTHPAGSIITFSGLQPASLGTTYFAYLKIENGFVVEVREKESFTENRLSEEASAGIYYFSSWDIFSEGYLRMLEGTDSKKEQYVSLIYNELIHNEELITIFSVSKFVCLGTPEDYREFMMWYDFFYPKNQIGVKIDILADLAIIPMAGKGQRFVDEGYRLPKPFIPIREIPMFLQTVSSLPNVRERHLLVQKEYLDRVRKTLSSNFDLNNIALHEVDQSTNGPGATILLHRDLLLPGISVIVSSCDYEHHFDESSLKDIIDEDIHGIIFTSNYSAFRMKHPEAFAYCVIGDDGYIEKVVEKATISDSPGSDPLVVGTFWFREANLLKEALEFAEANKTFINGEIYVGNSINSLIARGYKFKIFEVFNWISYGDPFELDIYYWWSELMHKNNRID